MKLVGMMMAIMLISVLAISCKKDKEEAGFVMEGLWSGKIGTGVQIPNGQYSIFLKKGGVIERVNSSGTATATGTWSINGTAFTAQYTFTSGGTVVNLTGTLNKELKRLSGDWTNDGDEEGSWYATQQ